MDILFRRFCQLYYKLNALRLIVVFSLRPHSEQSQKRRCFIYIFKMRFPAILRCGTPGQYFSNVSIRNFLNGLKMSKSIKEYITWDDFSGDTDRPLFLRRKLITYLPLPLIESISIHKSIFYLRPYIISHNSQCGLWLIIYGNWQTQTQI
jgi:hypothetical protein